MDQIKYRCDLCHAYTDHKISQHAERSKLRLVNKDPEKPRDEK